MRFLLRNWHLKLASVGLAMILYTGIVFSGSFSDATLQSPIPIETIRQPDDWYLFPEGLDPVEVDYRVANELRSQVTPDDFRAVVDLSAYDTSRPAEPQSLPVLVTTVGGEVTVRDWRPRAVTLRLDVLAVRSVPVAVDRGTVPEGYEVGTPTLSVDEVEARGPQSLLSGVIEARATVRVDPSGLDVSDQVDLVPVDADGQPVRPISLAPSSVVVEIPVRQIETNKTLPIAWDIEGNPADGFTLRSVSADPAVVTVRGNPDDLVSLTQIATRPISIVGASADQTFVAELILPEGVRRVRDEEVTLTVEIAADVGSRTFVTGVICADAPAGGSCLPQLGQLSVTLAGTVSVLNGLTPADVTPVVSVAGLSPGVHRVLPVFSLPDGVQLVSVSPGEVPVVVEPAPTPPPEPTPTPTPSPPPG